MTNFTEADVRAGANAQSYSRGAEYYDGGAVLSVARRGDVITAEVEGSDYEPYEVSVTLNADGSIGSATCTCPYDWGGYCKHIVAALLATLREPDDVEAKPDVGSLLTGLTEAQLRRILRTVAEASPAFADAVEQEVKWIKMEPVAGNAAAATATKAPSIAVDIAAIRRELRKDLRNLNNPDRSYRSDYFYDDEYTVDFHPVLGPHLATVEALLAAGDAATAISVLVAVIEEWGEGIAGVEEWIFESNEETFAEATQDLDVLLAEALLSQDLSSDQREQWQARVDDWAEDVLSLEVTAAALDTWWDYAPLVAAMQGHITEQGVWEGESPHFADALALARLRVLERQGRTQEYIHLATAEGQLGLATQMLARTGQVARAVEQAVEYLTEPGELLTLARVLVELGQPAAALTVASHGLDQPYQPYQSHGTELARWTATLAQQAGDHALALRAAEAAFLRGYMLDDYRTAQALAGDVWPEVKGRLLASLQQSNAYNKVDIYLYEKMLVEAMAQVDKGAYGADLERVIQATRAQYPDWGVQKCKRQAEGIMDGGKAKYYDDAIVWLRLAREILVEHGRQAEWQGYLASLLEIHARKYKLVPMLRGIR